MFKRVVAFVAVLSACGVPEVGSEDVLTQSRARLDDESVVRRLADGVFRNESGVEVTVTPSGPSRRYYRDWGYWVDLSVKNLAFEKRVGIVWTIDGWKTTNTTYAQYEGRLDGTHERWGVDLTGRTFSGDAPTLEYAAFAAMNGTTYWGKQDNWKNYVLRP